MYLAYQILKFFVIIYKLRKAVFETRDNREDAVEHVSVCREILWITDGAIP
jgi:hypothetical protein